MSDQVDYRYIARASQSDDPGVARLTLTGTLRLSTAPVSVQGDAAGLGEGRVQGAAVVRGRLSDAGTVGGGGGSIALSGTATITPYALIGPAHISATAVLTGTLRGQGEMASTAVLGMWSYAKLERDASTLAGHVRASGAVSGNLSGDLVLSGHIAAQATLIGSLTTVNIGPAHIAAHATLTGTLDPSGIKHLLSAIAGRSTVRGRIGNLILLRGHVGANSTLKGDLNATTLRGSVAGKSSIFGKVGYDVGGEYVAQTRSAEQGDVVHSQLLENQPALDLRYVAPSLLETLASQTRRRTGFYAEVARNVLEPGWAHNPRTQAIPRNDQPPGRHIATCRMADMREGTIVSYSYRDSDPYGQRAEHNVVDFYSQGGAESFDWDARVHTGTHPIGSLSLVSEADCLNHFNMTIDKERRLAALVYLLPPNNQQPYSLIYVSEDRGHTWALCYDGRYDKPAGYTSPRKMYEPSMVMGSNGDVYVFYRDGGNPGSTIHALNYLRCRASMSVWRTGFGWSAAGTTGINLWPAISAANPYPIRYDVAFHQGWWTVGLADVTRWSNIGQRGGDTVNLTIGYSATAAPTGFTLQATQETMPKGTTNAVEWVRAARVGGANEFGQVPAGRRLMVYALRTSGIVRMYYTTMDRINSVTTWPHKHLPLPHNAGEWGSQKVRKIADPTQPAGADEWGLQTWEEQWQAGALDRKPDGYGRASWNGIRTPSTRTIYARDPNSLGENLGPTVYVDSAVGSGDFQPVDSASPIVDAVDTFGHWWGRSNERESIMFPPYNGQAVACEFSFKVSRYTRYYHNIMLIVEDPRHPETPIFYANYYVGRNAQVYTDEQGNHIYTHPHDTARGLRIHFCGRVLVDVPVRNQRELNPRGEQYFEHPLPWMFSGYDSRDDLYAHAWQFRIGYNPADDTLELYWKEPKTHAWVPFVPYAYKGGAASQRRELLDVGGAGQNPPDFADRYRPHPDGVSSYWKRPRGGLWPTRIMIGNPLTTPAVEVQSGMWFGPMKTWRGGKLDSVKPLGKGQLLMRLSGSVDFWHTSQQGSGRPMRQTYGWPWEDVWTATQFESNWDADGGPDSASLTIVNAEGVGQGPLFDNLRDYHCMVWERAGYREKSIANTGTTGEKYYTESGEWGNWVTPFFGTSDTGTPHEGDGPYITMRLFSPLRRMSRSYKTQGFTTIQPVGLEEEGEIIEQPRQIARAQQLVIMTPYKGSPDVPPGTDPAGEWRYVNDPNLPYDRVLGRSMHYEDYITWFVWVHMLGNDPAKLQIDRVGFRPSHFGVNEAGAPTADLLDDLRRAWAEFGLTWYFDFFEGGTLKVKKRTFSEVPDYTLYVRSTVAVPFTEQEDDWGRAGNVIATTLNMEQRPNYALARVAPWPDGADTVEQNVGAVSGMPSQHAHALMISKNVALKGLYREWEGSHQLTVDFHALPYLRPTNRIRLLPDANLPPRFVTRYKRLFRVWEVRGIRNTVDTKRMVSSANLVPATPFSFS